MLAVSALLALNFFLLDVRPFWLATILIVANNVALLVISRPARVGPGLSRTNNGFSRTLVIAAAVALLFTAAYVWLRQILVIPIDPQRADMLVVIQLGIRRLLQGHTPYTMYQVPWPATLPYGPVMWAPMIAPYVLHADIRFATVFGAILVATMCALAAPKRADWLVVLAAIAFSADLRNFISIGHTPAYWPLLPLFARTLRRERWVPAAVVCGLLIVARTTMVALAPALVFAVWQRARAQTVVAVLALVAAVAIPLLPFAIVDAASLKYALYGSYQHVIKGFVWTSTDWAVNTIGVTGLLLARGWGHLVELVQIAALLLTAVVTWIRLRRGDDPVIWAGFSLLVFSMTTLWPVVYLYFDVFLLFVSAVLVRTESIRWPRSLGLASIVLVVTTLVSVPPRASIDVGQPGARPFLYAGFSSDEHAGDRNYVWIDGTRAKILVPSLVRRDAVLRMVCEPYVAVPNGRQQLTAALNGVVLGTMDIGDGWRQVSFSVPSRAWQIGVNELDVFLASATAPRDAGEGPDTRRLSLAIDRLDVTKP